MLPDVEGRIEYFGNVSTVTPYPIGFRWDDDTWITVQIDANDGTPATTVPAYQVALTGATDPSGGEAVLAVAVPNTSTVIITRDTPLTQEKNFPYNGRFSTVQLEAALDKLTMELQDVSRGAEDATSELSARTLRVPVGETVSELPDASSRAGFVQGYDSAGQPEMVSYDTIVGGASGTVPAGVGIASGGNKYDVLEKSADTNYSQQWAGPALSSNDPQQGLYTGNMLRIHRQLIELEQAVPSDGYWVTVAGQGDSIAESGTGPLGPLLEDIESRYGCGALISTPFNTGLGTTYNSLGTAAVSASLVTATYTYLPNGQYYSVLAGGSVTDSPFLADRRTGFYKIVCIYGRRSGGGTITATVTQNGSPLSGGAKAANTSTGTVGSIGFLTFPSADGLGLNGPPSIAITNAGGTSHYLGTIAYLTSGLVRISLSRGGTSFAQQQVYPTQNLIDLCSTLDIGMMGHGFKEEDLDGSDLVAYVDKICTNIPAVSNLFINSSPESSNDPAAIALNAILLKKCKQYGVSLLNQRAYLRTYAEMVAEGIEGDGTHGTPCSRELSGEAIKYAFLRGLPAFAVKSTAFNREDASRDFLTRQTWRSAHTNTYTLVTAGTSVNWIANQTPGFNGFTADSATGPLLDTRAGYIIQTRTPWHLNYDSRFRFGLAEINPSGTQTGFALGVTGSAVNTTLTESGLWIQIHGGTSPFVRILLHDGTNLYTSPDFLLPKDADIDRGYKPTAGVDPFHNFGVHFISNGGVSTTKEVKVWMAPNHPANAATTAFRPYLVAHWKQVVSAPAPVPSSDAKVCFRVVTGGSPVSYYYPVTGFLFFEFDQSADDITTAAKFNQR